MLRVNGVEIEDTFAEAFKMRAARAIVTAETAGWARTAATLTSGYATSVIGCDAEVGIEAEIPAPETPDGRPGVSLLVFGFNTAALGKALVNRIGQCVMTCPTTACFNGLSPGEETVKVGALLRFFGDGHQASKKLEGRRYWRVPVMDGEFLCEDTFGVQRAVAGGNFLILAKDQAVALHAAEAAVAAIRAVPGVILPFPGGVVRSGSKVGSRYKALMASTNHELCPTLRAQVDDSQVPEGIGSVFEIVIDGLAPEPVREAMRVGLAAAANAGARQITAGNYGGNLGKHHFHLKELVP